MIRRSLSRIKRILHFRLRYRRLHSAWKKRHATVFSANPPYRRKLSPGVEAEHKKLWQDLVPSVPMETLRISAAISGTADSRIIPEEIFPLVIEPALNSWSEAAFLANKSVYNRWFTDERFPQAFLHYHDGVLYDCHFGRISHDQLSSRLASLDYPVVVKPTWDSSGGRGVRFPSSPEELADVVISSGSCTVQEYIRQHPYFSRFNSTSTNTLRVCLYRSVSSGQITVLNMAMRCGIGGSLDNEASGGLVCHVNSDGRLNDYAVNKCGTKYFRHPVSEIAFSQCGILPNLSSLYALAVDTAEAVFGSRLSSLDMCMDESGEWRVIEINLRGQSIRQVQYAGVPFFGEFTDEVIEYCRLALNRQLRP